MGVLSSHSILCWRWLLEWYSWTGIVPNGVPTSVWVTELIQHSTSVSMKEEGRLSRFILHSTTVTILQSQLFIKNKYYTNREREREKQETRLKKINYRISRFQTKIRNYVKQMISYRLPKFIKLIVKISNNLIMKSLKLNWVFPQHQLMIFSNLQIIFII